MGDARGVPAVRLVRPLAAAALLAIVVGRGAAPAMVGAVVGIDRAVDWIKTGGDGLTQLFAIFAVAVTAGELMALLASRVPLALRVAAGVLAGAGVLLALSAAAARVSELPMAAIGGGVSVFAIAMSIHASKKPPARIPAMVLGLVGAAGVARLLGVGLAVLSTDGASRPGLATFARGLATVALVLHLAAMAVAATSSAVRAKRTIDPRTFAILALAFLATRQAIVGAGDNASTMSVLLHRIVDRLSPRPEPLLPHPILIFAVVLAPIVAANALIGRRTFAPFASTIALAVLVGAAPEVPLYTLAMLIAAMTLGLAAHDERGLWASITKAPSEPSPAND